MTYSLKICLHLTFRSNINTHESERETQNSLFPISGKTMQLQKNLIEKLYECKLSLFWGAMDVTYCKVRAGNQVNTNLSDITISIQFDCTRQRAKKHLHFSMKEKRARRGQGYSTKQKLLPWSYCIKTHTYTVGGNACVSRYYGNRP